jgi:hypothetical protein
VPPIATGSDHGHGVDVFAAAVDGLLLVNVVNAANRGAGDLGSITVVDAKTGRGLLSRTLRTQKGPVGVDLKSRDIGALRAERERVRVEIDRLRDHAKAVERRIDALQTEKLPDDEAARPEGDD